MHWLAFNAYLIGFLVAAAYDDLSHNKVATQSQIYPSSNTLYIARNAVDRNPSTCMRTEEIGRHSPYKTMWWKVDLGGVYNIYSINILFKNYDGFENRQRGRFAGFSLYLSNTGEISGSTLCYKDKRDLPHVDFSIVCAEYGRYVIFYNERLDAVTYPGGYELLNVYIELCEVTVKGCNISGVYGNNCNIPCPTNCKNDTCHIQDGICSSCKSGWTGTSCKTKCQEWWFGDNCSQQCVGHCRDNNTCNHVTGQCDGGCDAGWTGTRCAKECNGSTYGYNCVNNCSGHCLNDSPCNKQTGHCDRGCNPGYTTNNCSKECLYGYYGTDCREQRRGHCKNNKTCDHISGKCPDGCEDGYTGKLCNNSCDEGYYGANCTLTCFPNCNICQHTDGSCSSCKNGYYGRKCSLVCFPNCKSDTCQPKDSLCTCAAGWMGDNCTEECDKMWYGVNCCQRCVGHCKDNDTCNHITGQCDGGCDAGWTQSACDKECDDGSYGFDCVNNCSGHCLNNSSCEKQNGQCKNGCNPGYTTLLCDEQVLQHASDNKDNSTSTTFLLISLTINSAFLTGCFLLIWGIYTKRVSILGFNPSCWKRSEHYADTDIKTGEDTTYQELGPPIEEISMTYQNIILQ